MAQQQPEAGHSDARQLQLLRVLLLLINHVPGGAGQRKRRERERSCTTHSRRAEVLVACTVEQPCGRTMQPCPANAATPSMLAPQTQCVLASNELHKQQHGSGQVLSNQQRMASNHH